MKIYQRKFSSIVKSYFLNILAALVVLLIAANLVDLIYALIVTFIVYSYLMIQTFILDKTRFELENNKFRKVRGRKKIFEYDLKGKKIRKEITPSVIGHSKKLIYIDNIMINANMLNLETFNNMFTDLTNRAK